MNGPLLVLLFIIKVYISYAVIVCLCLDLEAINHERTIIQGMSAATRSSELSVTIP